MFDRLFEKLNEVAGDQEKFDYFLERTNKHIKLVQIAAEKIVDAYPEEFVELIKEVEDHDSSKLKDPEMTPYIDITWRHKLEKEDGEFDPIKGKGYQTPGKLEKKAENEATLHHIKSNTHHPEFWLDDKTKANISSTNRDDSIECVDASKMPDINVAEMIADWQAMATEIGTNTAREWFDKVKDVRWHFSKHQEELIDRLLKVFEKSAVEENWSSMRGPKDQLGLIHADGKVLKINIGSSHSAAMDKHPNFREAIEYWLLHNKAELVIRFNAPLTSQQVRAIQKVIDKNGIQRLEIEIYPNDAFKKVHPIPKNWPELIRKMEKEEGVPRESRKGSDGVEEARNSHSKCMKCSKVPEVEVLWAEGRGHAWFCMKHFKEWATKGDGKGDVDAVKKVQGGKASKKWGDNTSPNIISSMKFL